MKRLLYVLWVCLFTLICSCINKPIEVPTSLNESLGTTKSIDEAVSDMYEFWAAVYGNNLTKVIECPRPEIESVVTCTNVETKATKRDENLAYIVNFKNNSGYSILNAHKGGVPVFAFIESGSIDADKLINEVKNQKAREIRYLSKQDFMDKPHRDNPNFYYSVLAETILELSETDKTPSTKTVDDTTLEILDTCQPLVTSKWGQRYPFNQSMKYWLFASYTPQYRKRSPVGCGIVAAAQMMQVVNHPVFSSLVAGYSWSDFNDICKYYNYSSFLYDSFDDSATNTQKTKMAKLAKGLSLIADAFDADYYETSTLVNIFDVKDALVSYDSYYSNAAIAYPNYQMGVLINMLDNGKPAYYRGEQYIPSSNSYEGHAWVVDGYLHVEESWNGGNNTMSYYCLHHNWGWYGLHDGYYTQSSYLASDRFDYDSTVDRSYIDYSDTDNYISTRQFISY